MKNISVQKIVMMGLFIALCYIGTMFNISFSIGASKTMIHFGNIFCLLAALVLGGVSGGICGSLGMGIFDLTNGWVLYAPSTFILKFFIALICGYTFNLMQKKGKKIQTSVFVACLAGMLFNLICSPIANFLTSYFLLHTEVSVAQLIALYQSITVIINAIIATLVASSLYLALLPVLKRYTHIKD